MRLVVIFGFLMILVTASTVPAVAEIVADSVNEFSDRQGQDNWYFGYYDGDSTAPFSNTPGKDDFEQLPFYNATDDRWELPPGPAGNVFIIVGRDWGHPDHRWSVRRWVSELSGEVTISGEFFKQNPGSFGDGVIGRILIDGVEVWSQYIATTDSTGVKYEVTTTLNTGSLVDFAIDASGNARQDSTEFTAIIEAFVPAEDAPELGINTLVPSSQTSAFHLIGRNIRLTGVNEVTANLELTNLTGTWFEAVIDFSAKPNPVNVTEADIPFAFVMGPHQSRTFKNIVFLDNQVLYFKMDRDDTGAYAFLAIDLITRGLFATALSPENIDQITKQFGLEWIKALGKEIKQDSVVHFVALTSALSEGDSLGAAQAFTEFIASTSQFKESLVDVIRAVHPENAVKYANIVGKVIGLLDVPEKLILLKQLTEGTLEAPLDDNVYLQARINDTQELPEQDAFTDVAASAGVNDSGHRRGVAAGDYDNDGNLDFYLAGESPNRLFRANGDGTLSDVGSSAGVVDTRNSRASAWGDYDNDGDLDLYLANTQNSANRLYRNNADGTFTDIADGAGVADAGDTIGVAWGDYDGDGDLDLYLANQAPNRLYQNNGDSTFTEVGASAGVADSGQGQIVAWGDYDSDGDLDLYLTNWPGTNRLYQNNGDGTFTEVGASARVADTGESIGVAWGDYDNNGALDLYVSKFNTANRLYRNNGHGTFTEVAASAGVNDNQEGRGVAWFDYDHDGDVDLYLAIGSGANRFYRNNGNGTFTDVAVSMEVADTGGACGVISADYDNDGDLDLYLINPGSTDRLYRNNQDDPNFLFVRPLDGQGRFNRHGATVRVFQAGTRNLVGTRVIDGGSSYLSQNAYDSHFGLDASQTYDVEVTFPGGVVATVANVSPTSLPDHRLEVRQPQTQALFSVPEQVGIGGTFAAWLVVEDVNDLAGLQLDLLFDPEILEATQVEEGDFLKQDGTGTFWQGGAIDNTQGSITGINVARLGGGGVNGTGTLLTVTFNAKKSGETTLRSENAQFGDSSGSSIPVQVVPGTVVVGFAAWDVNEDGQVNIFDLIIVAQNFGQQVLQNPRVDVNSDSQVNIFDLIVVAQHFGGATSAAPSAQTPGQLTADMVESWIAEARTVDDGSEAFRIGIDVLERLLSAMIPQKTALLPVYPNPFNPETWIPYQLHKASHVTFTIYDAKGRAVRRIEVGHQAAGMYRTKARAAYWNGRNDMGESVASGVYFVELRAANYRQIRRMVVLK